MKKYKLTWKDLSLNDFKVYFFSLFKAFIPKSKIKNLDQLEEFIQTKSAWVSQVTLYSYLKTRMGTRYVLHFDNDEFMKSVNEAKWNIYAVALQDLTFFTFSYLKNNFNFEDTGKSKEIFLKILDNETTNEYCNDIPFNQSALSLYEWAPIAEELKSLDRKIVLNSVILKWDIIKKEFKERIQF
jgi:hypothetical protein